MRVCDCVKGEVCRQFDGIPFPGVCKISGHAGKSPLIDWETTDGMATITAQDKTADFVADASTGILENKRKVVFQQGRDLNLRDVVEVNLDGQWWRVKTADGKLHLVNAAVVNYATIA